MIIKLVTLEGASRRKDRSASIRFQTTAEQSQAEMAELDGLFQQHCIIAIKEEDMPFSDIELKDLDSINIDLYDTNKSQAKRIRNTLWVIHEQHLGRKPTEKEFAEYYHIKTEQIIEHLKSKIRD